TIDLLLELDDQFAASVSSSICSLATLAFLQYPDDPTIFDVVLSLLERLFKIDQCFPEMQQRLLPILVPILAGEPNDPALSFDQKMSQQKIAILQPQMLDI